MWQVGYVRNENEEIIKFNSYLRLKNQVLAKVKVVLLILFGLCRNRQNTWFLPFSQPLYQQTQPDISFTSFRKTDVIHPTVNKSKHIIIEPAASLTSSQPSLSLLQWRLDACTMYMSFCLLGRKYTIDKSVSISQF